MSKTGQVIVKSGGFISGLSGLAAILTIIFACAKLFAGTAFTWLQVFLPVIIVWGGSLAIGLAIILVVVVIAVIVALIKAV